MVKQFDFFGGQIHIKPAMGSFLGPKSKRLTQTLKNILKNSSMTFFQVQFQVFSSSG